MPKKSQVSHKITKFVTELWADGVGLLGQPGDQDLVCHLILVQSSFGIYESSSQNAQEGHKFRAAFAVHHSKTF